MGWYREEDLEGYEFYIAQHIDDEFLEVCASGGVFAAIATAFVERGGVVFGAVYDNDLRVVHTSAESVDGVRAMMGSKYVQSFLGDCFRLVEGYLRDGKEVLFSGAPCQVAGLRSYLAAKCGSDSLTSKLFLIDFVCHGVGSPMVLESYVAEEKRKGFNIVSMNMRSKYRGYRNSSMELAGEAGKARHTSTRVDCFLGAFYSNCISRPACHECAFKGIRRPSDITIWDSWSAEMVLGRKPDNKGYTNVIARGERGEGLLFLAESQLALYKVDFASIAPRNGGMLTNSCKKSPLRDKYLAIVADRGIKAASNELLPIGPRDRVRELAKTLLWRVGMLDLIARGKRSIK